MVVESNPDVISAFQQNKYYRFINGNATLDEVLIEAGIQSASTVITALKEDSDNVFITLTARELNPNINIIAKILKNLAKITKLLQKLQNPS